MRVRERGQVTAELAVLFAFVIGGFVAMGFYLQRGVQGSTKANTDSIGTQFSKTGAWNSQSVSQSYERQPVGATNVKTTSVSCSQGSQAMGGASVDQTIQQAIDSVSTADDCVPGAGLADGNLGN